MGQATISPGKGTWGACQKENWGDPRGNHKLLEHHSLVPTVRQDPLLGSSETFNSFLRRAQQVRLWMGPSFKGSTFLQGHIILMRWVQRSHPGTFLYGMGLLLYQ